MKRISKKRFTVRLYRLVMGFYRPAFYKPFFVAALFLSLIACTNEDSDPGEAAEPAGAPVISGSDLATDPIDATSSAGTFELEEGVTSFQIIARSEGQELRLVTLEDPTGRVIYNAERPGDLQSSAAGELQPSPNVFSYPLTAQDGQPAAGTYQARYETRVPGGSQTVAVAPTIDLVTKNDQDLSRGTINLNLFYSSVVTNSTETREALDYTFETVREIFERAGLSLFIEEFHVEGLPEVLPNPYEGDPLYDEGSKAVGEGINIYFATDVTGLRSPNNSSGMAGSSPGPVLPSPRSAIAISISQAAGSDGRFDSASADDDDNYDSRDSIDDSEIRLLAEVIVHEISHYLGLQDTVTFGGGRVVASDNLNSEKCPNVNACEENKGANGNIMFPYPLRIENSDEELFFPRDRVSSQQIEVIQRYVGVD